MDVAGTNRGILFSLPGFPQLRRLKLCCRPVPVGGCDRRHVSPTLNGSGWPVARTAKRRPGFSRFETCGRTPWWRSARCRTTFLSGCCGFLEHSLYRHATRLVAVSDGIRNRLIEKGVPPEKIGVVPNGVDLDRIAAPGRRSIRLHHRSLPANSWRDMSALTAWRKGSRSCCTRPTGCGTAMCILFSLVTVLAGKDLVALQKSCASTMHFHRPGLSGNGGRTSAAMRRSSHPAEANRSDRDYASGQDLRSRGDGKASRRQRGRRIRRTGAKYDAGLVVPPEDIAGLRTPSNGSRATPFCGTNSAPAPWRSPATSTEKVRGDMLASRYVTPNDNRRQSVDLLFSR